MMKVRSCRFLAASMVVAVAAAAGPARADELLRVDFENMEASGWTANGVVTIEQGRGNPGNALFLPYMDFQGVSLSAREPASMVLGDLTQVGPMRVTADIQVFQAHNWFGDPLDMSQWPMVFEIIDYGNPDEGIPFATVYYVTETTWPEQNSGWTTYSFDIPDPSSEALPAGWGGTGDSHPQTGEPRLPKGVTYRSVLSSVDEVRVTTYVPGFFYIANFWEVGFDNIVVESLGGGNECRADFNGDENVNSQDFFDFVTAFFAEDRTADFNGDTVINSQDFFDFVGAFFVGC